MGGSAVYDEQERTVVLVGKTGNGKSATGNSIIGTKKFKSKCSSGGVTQTCQLRTTEFQHGNCKMILNVIDTPGLFDAEHEHIGKEIVKCIDMAKEGIHAVLLVLSVKSRFSQEEAAAVETLKRLFSSKIVDYMIIVFTNGDEFEESEESLKDYLDDCPQPLKEILEMCEYRFVLFDNRTKDEAKKHEQLTELLFLVNDVVDTNGGKPYTDELFAEMKKGAAKLRDPEFNSMKQFNKTYEDQLQRITEMVESKLKETTHKLEQQLAEEQKARLEEQKARLKAEELARDAHTKSSDEMRLLRENWERAQRETEEQKAQIEEQKARLKAEESANLERAQRETEELRAKLEEQKARLKAEESARDAHKKSIEEMRQLRENLERAQRETEELRRMVENGKCAIL